MRQQLDHRRQAAHRISLESKFVSAMQNACSAPLIARGQHTRVGYWNSFKNICASSLLVHRTGSGEVHESDAAPRGVGRQTAHTTYAWLVPWPPLHLLLTPVTLLGVRRAFST